MINYYTAMFCDMHVCICLFNTKKLIPYQVILCRARELKCIDSESAVKSEPAADVIRRRRENVQVSHKIMNGKEVKSEALNM